MRTVDARPMRTSRLFDALPPYLGGKRRLVPLILADLAAELPAAEWPGASFCDPMCGGGAVAVAPRRRGSRSTPATARAEARSSRLPSSPTPPFDCGRRTGCRRCARMISERTGPRPSSVFTAAQARRIDGLLTAAAARQAPTRALLELLAIKLVCRLFPMSLPNATDAARAAAGAYDTIRPHAGSVTTCAAPMRTSGLFAPWIRQPAGPAHPRDRDQRGRDRRPRARHPSATRTRRSRPARQQ